MPPIHTHSPARFRFDRPVERQSGFSLIELLMVIAVIAILGAILVPSIQAVRERAYVAKTVSNLRQLQAANELYASQNKGRYVEAVPYDEEAGGRDSSKVWFMDDEFMALAGYEDQRLGYDGALYPEIAKTGIGGIPFPGDSRKQDSELTIGINIGNRQQWTPVPLGFQKSRIVEPSRAIAFGDAGSYWIRAATATRWTDDASGRVGTSLAFRHDGKAAVVFFDGATALVTKEQVEGNDAYLLPEGAAN